MDRQKRPGDAANQQQRKAWRGGEGGRGGAGAGRGGGWGGRGRGGGGNFPGRREAEEESPAEFPMEEEEEPERETAEFEDEDYMLEWAQREAELALGEGPDREGGSAMWAEGEAQRVALLQPYLQRWRRREPKPGFEKESLSFQQLDIDYFIADCNHGGIRGKEPVIRMFGVTAEGNSVCAFVRGFDPYFFVRAPAGFTADDLNGLQKDLEAKMAQQQQGCPVVVKGLEMKKLQSLMFFLGSNAPSQFIKITLALPTQVASCRSIFENGYNFNGFEFQQTTYESNVLFALRFMIDHKIGGGHWVEIPAGKYTVRDDRKQQKSSCQIEVEAHSSDLICHEAMDRWSGMAPFRILSFDIECSGRKGMFPEPEHDPVIQIATLVTEQGQDKPAVRTVLTLNSCAPIVGADVLSFDTEQAMLMAWRDIVEATDPDLIIGYNIIKFDLPYLIERAEKLKLAKFPFLGRLRGVPLRMRDSRLQSRQMGIRESKEITMEGRVQLDLLQAIQRDHKLSSYSLNSVSAHFLNEQKEDVHHSIIADLQNGDPQTRRRLAVYCLKDAYLPQRLLDKLKCVYNYVEVARVTGVPMSFLLTRGQSIKVLSQILRKAQQRGLVVPNMKSQGVQSDSTYEGATVLEPKAGFYEKPVATLDFASLYPSIMMAHNLCYSTLVPKGEEHRLGLSADATCKSPSGDVFVKADVRKGILPEILEELLAARKRAKAALKSATDPVERAVLDGRQLALKLSANSVYGFTGATVGALPCLEISSSVTAYGRTMIEHTRQLVEEKYSMKNGYSHDATVIYGDTDSVMVLFGTPDVEPAMKLGKEAADYISTTFPKPIKLEFEKVYFPYLLISKKRYAGLLWTNPAKYDKMDTKGIETVRRDNCLLVRQVVDECLRRILIERDVASAVSYVKSTISDLLMNRMDLSLLVITKQLSKGGDDYAVKAAHVELAERMRKRDAATAPGIGDRVAYVIIKAPKGAKAYEKSEDPIHVLENNIPIDPQYYLENQLSKPLLRLFDPILKNASRELLSGAHTRAVSISTPTTGGIMKFAKVRLTCLGCKAPLKDGKGPLCEHCRSREVEIYQKSVTSVRQCEEQFSKLWVQCQRCQGSLHQDVLCTSRDCPIFYRRKKAQKDVEEAYSVLSRFDF